MAKRTDNFQKFLKQPKGSAIKEKIKQEKKKEKRERAAAIEEHFARKREEKLRQRGIDPGTTSTAKPGKFSKEKTTNKYAPKAASSANERTGNPSFENRKAKAGKFDKKPFNSKSAEPGADSGREEKSIKPQAERFEKPKAPFSKEKKVHPNAGKLAHEKSFASSRSAEAKKPGGTEKKDYTSRPFSTKQSKGEGFKKRDQTDQPTTSNKTAGKLTEREKPAISASSKTEKPTSPAIKTFDKSSKGGKPQSKQNPPELMPLNKYIAHSGVCARRDAAELVKNGKVTVNDELVTDPGTKVSQYDVVKVSGNTLTISKNFVYILLNKPKDYITTSDDPQGRKTVLDLVRTATSERVYPVGRLDRNTSGVLLLTNDGDLAQKLSHPKHEIKKVYEVRLDRNLTKHDMEKIAAGINLEDGMIAPDVIAYADSKDKSIIGIEIHSGRNRIVRRIFEHMKYDVKALDRVMFAGLTKKDVQRGNWRFLKEKEVRLLKYMNQSYVKSKE